jgi:hypothetical protein
LELPGAMNIHNHRGGLTRYYPKQSRWLKQTLHRWLESDL